MGLPHDGNWEVRVPNDRDPAITLRQLQPLAAMNRIFLKGKVTEEDFRQGVFYEPSWKLYSRFKGKFSISRKVIRFWGTSLPRTMSHEKVDEKLSFVRRDLTHTSLRELEDGYEVLKRNLQRTESTRDVYLALMKSLPYVIISLLVALLTVALYEKTADESTFFAGLVASVAFILLFIAACHKSRSKDSHIASLGIYCNQVNAVAEERRTQIKRRFHDLNPKHPIDPTDYAVSVLDMVGANANQVLRLDSSFDSTLLEDVEYEYPLASKRLSNFVQGLTEYTDCLSSFEINARKMILKVAEIERPGTPSKQDLSETIRALYLVCSGIIASRLQFAAEKAAGLTDSTHIVEKCLSKEPDNEGYCRLAKDSELTAAAVETRRRFDNCMKLHYDLLTAMRFVFGTR